MSVTVHSAKNSELTSQTMMEVCLFSTKAPKIEGLCRLVLVIFFGIHESNGMVRLALY